MRKADLDHLLLSAVAKALGVKLPPRLLRRNSAVRKVAAQSVRRAA